MPAPRKEGDEGDEGKETPVTLEAVQKLIDASLNGAVKAQLKKFVGGQEFQVALAQSVKSALKPAAGEGDEESEGDDAQGDTKPGKGKKGDAGALPAEVRAMLEAADARTKKLEKSLAEERRIRTEGETKRLRDEERQLLSEALMKGGVQKDMIKPALALLLHEEKRVKRGQDGAVAFAHEDEDHEVEAGVGKWLATDMGQRFMPTKSAEGSGATGGRVPAGTGGKPPVVTDAQLGTLLGQMG